MGPTTSPGGLEKCHRRRDVYGGKGREGDKRAKAATIVGSLEAQHARADRTTILDVTVPEAQQLKRGFRRRYAQCDPHLALQTRPRPRCDADPELILSRVRGLCLAPWRGKFDPVKSSAMSAPMRASLYAACLRRIVPPFRLGSRLHVDTPTR